MDFQKIKYPIFLECCSYTENAFWDFFFKRLANGEQINLNIKFIEDKLLFQNHKKKITYNFKKINNPETIYKDIMSKLNELNIFSNQFFSPVVKFEWSKIKKVQKQLYIELFILKNMNMYSLSVSQAKILLCIILLGINLKTITLSDIVFDGLIKNIKPNKFY